MQSEEIAELYERCGHLVHRRCLQLLGSEWDANDAHQEVFLRAQRYGRSRERGSSPLMWLYTIAAHCCFDLARKRGRERPLSHDHLADLEQRVSGSGHDADVKAVVGALLRKLDPRVREIGMLHYLDGLTQEEVAAQTGYSRRTVGKKLREFEEHFRAASDGRDTLENAR